jgi:hypothetical protein
LGIRSAASVAPISIRTSSGGMRSGRAWPVIKPSVRLYEANPRRRRWRRERGQNARPWSSASGLPEGDADRGRALDFDGHSSIPPRS